MNLDDIPDVVADLRRRFHMHVDMTRRSPVPLDAFFAEMTNPRLAHHTQPDLTRGKVLDHLRGHGIPVIDGVVPVEELAGFIYKAGRDAWVYVSRERRNPLGRQRLGSIW